MLKRTPEIRLQRSSRNEHNGNRGHSEPEQHREAPSLVAEHSPDDAAYEHAAHLHVQQQDPAAEDVRLGHSETAQSTACF